MLPLRDAQLRLVLLNHIAVRLSAGDPADLHSAGIESEQLVRLKELSAIDLSRLAAMRELGIGVALDDGRPQGGAPRHFARQGSTGAGGVLHPPRRVLADDVHALQDAPQAHAPAPPRAGRLATGGTTAASRPRDSRAHLPRVDGDRRSQPPSALLPAAPDIPALPDRRAGRRGGRVRGRRMTTQRVVSLHITAELLLQVFDLPVSCGQRYRSGRVARAGGEGGQRHLRVRRPALTFAQSPLAAPECRASCIS